MHSVTNCTQKLVCREKDCGLSHPTGMHGTHKFKGKAKSTTNAAQAMAVRNVMMPAKIQLKFFP